MLVLFINIIAVLTLVAVIGWSVLSFQKSSEVAAAVQKNTFQMATIGSQIRYYLMPTVRGGAVRAPAGERTLDGNGNPIGRTHLPKWLIADDTTPWGVEYGWCPYATGSAATQPTPTSVLISDTVTQAGTAATYATTNHLVRGHAYVDWSDNPPAGLPDDIVGFLVSPTPNQTALPACSDVTMTSDTKLFLVTPTGSNPPGTVVAIRSRGIAASSAAAIADDTIFVGPSATGTGLGTDSDNLMPLSAAFDYFVTAQPNHLTLQATAGALVIPNEVISATSGRSLTINGLGEGVTSITSSGSTTLEADIPVDFNNLTIGDSVNFNAYSRIGLSNVNFTANASMTIGYGGSVNAIGSTIGATTLNGGALTIDTTSTVQQYTPTGNISVFDGKMTIWGNPSGGQLMVTRTTPSPTSNVIDAYGGEIVYNRASIATVDGGQANVRIGAEARLHNVTGDISQFAQATRVQTAINDCVVTNGNLSCSAVCPAERPNVISGECTLLSASTATAPLMSAYHSASGSGTQEEWNCVWGAPTPAFNGTVSVSLHAQALCGAAPSIEPDASTMR